MLYAAPIASHLRNAKAASDAEQYAAKRMILNRLMREHPEDFVVDSDDGKGIVGITHIPTGFKLHTKRQTLPAKILNQSPDAGLQRPRVLPSCRGGE